MRVLVLGIGDAFTQLHFSTSALIQGPDGLVLLDCPDLIHRVLREGTHAAGWKADAADIDHVLLSHLHGDHCNGVESFGFWRRILRNRDPSMTRPTIHTSRPVSERLWERLAPAMEGIPGHDPPNTLDDFYNIDVLEPGEPVTVAGLTIQCRVTGHPIPTTGFLISDGQSTLGWSGDTPFEPAHIDWLSGADVIVHESNLSEVHTPIESLNDLPAELRAKIRLIHLPDDFDPAVTDMQPLRQGEVLDF